MKMAYVLIGASTCAFSDKGYYPYKRRRFLPAMYVHSLCNNGFSLKSHFVTIKFNQFYNDSSLHCNTHLQLSYYKLEYFYDLSTFAIQ